MLFVALDGTGAPNGAVKGTPGDTGRDLFATPSGFTALRNPFDPSGNVPPPVSLVTLDSSGQAGTTTQLLSAATPLDGFARVAFPDGSFLLVWSETGSCPECRDMHAEHFSARGASVAAAFVLHSFDASSSDSFAVAASMTGLLVAWSVSSDSMDFTLMAEPFDEDGNSKGTPTSFGHITAENAPTIALTSAPGGDLVAAWGTGLDGEHGSLFVEAVAPTGAPEGASTMLGSVQPDNDEDILVVASPSGAMVLYEDDPAQNGTQVFAIPIECAE
jgi:hypothetical protein